MEHIEAQTMRLLGTVPAASMRSSAVHFQSGDVLYGRLRPYLNKVFCPDFEGLCSAEFIVFPASDWLNSKYLQYLLNSSSFVSFASRLNAGDRPRVDFGQIGEYVAPLAPFFEQARIVAEIEKEFTRLDAAVAALKRVRANLKRCRAAVLKTAVEGRLVPAEAARARREGRSYEPASELLKRILTERRARWEAAQLAKVNFSGKRPKDDTWKNKYKRPHEPIDGDGLPVLPEGWCWTTAEQCTTIITDGEHITPERAESGVLLLSARNVLDGKLSFGEVDYVPELVYEKLARRLTIEPGDVLLSCSGTVGRSCVVPQEPRFALVRSVAVLKPLFGMGAYLSLSMRSPLLQSQISTKKTQTAQANIFQGKIKTLTIPLPPLAEQHRIVAEADRRLSIIEELEDQLETDLTRAERLRQSILKRAFEGKLVPQDPSDDSAGTLLERIRAEREARSRQLAEPRKASKPNMQRTSLLRRAKDVT